LWSRFYFQRFNRVVIGEITTGQCVLLQQKHYKYFKKMRYRIYEMAESVFEARILRLHKWRDIASDFDARADA
jgi:hypothetical protein